MKAYVVIGACFGDEGKGLTTDYLAAKHVSESLVVRFNGGAQAGHTVQTANGQRHVFKHFGSGCFAGSPTFLSEYFICNPILFRTELEQLHKFGLTPKIYVHPEAVVSTQYDMMINQIVEEIRSNSRHGSCGVGIGETVERNIHPQFAIQVQDLLDENKLREKLSYIQQYWVTDRLAHLGIQNVSNEWLENITSSGILEYYLQEVKYFMAHTTMIGNQVIHDYSTVIFEGAQGLLLDQDKGFFPHVTRSYTGLNNVLAIAQKTGIKQLEVFYTARSYLTRHGAGPLPFELPAAPYTKISDQTNVNNMYQGSLRFAWFNFDLLEGAIYTDLAQVPNDIKINPHILISCMDQLDDQVKYVLNDKLLTLYKQNFLDKVQTRFHNFNIWQSNGPSRATISMLKSAVSSQIQECA